MYALEPKSTLLAITRNINFLLKNKYNIQKVKGYTVVPWDWFRINEQDTMNCSRNLTWSNSLKCYLKLMKITEIDPGTKGGPLIILSLIPGTKPGLFYYNDL